LAIANTITAASVIIRLNSDVSVIASGITSRGKRTLRSRCSRSTSEERPLLVVSAKNWKSTSANRM